ncbi:hypothetical protein PG995_007727 [Apiospora arundinis]
MSVVSNISSLPLADPSPPPFPPPPPDIISPLVSVSTVFETVTQTIERVIVSTPPVATVTLFKTETTTVSAGPVPTATHVCEWPQAAAQEVLGMPWWKFWLNVLGIVWPAGVVPLLLLILRRKLMRCAWFRTVARWVDCFDRDIIKKGEKEETEDKDRSGVCDLWCLVWDWVKKVSGWVFAAVSFVLVWLWRRLPLGNSSNSNRNSSSSNRRRRPNRRSNRSSGRSTGVSV